MGDVSSFVGDSGGDGADELQEQVAQLTAQLDVQEARIRERIIGEVRDGKLALPAGSESALQVADSSSRQLALEDGSVD